MMKSIPQRPIGTNDPALSARRAGGWPDSVTPRSFAISFASIHVASRSRRCSFPRAAAAHRAARVSGTRVVNHRFQAVPTSTRYFALVGATRSSTRDCRAASHPSCLYKSTAKFSTLSPSTNHRNHGDLRASLFLDLVAEASSRALVSGAITLARS